MTDVTSCVEGQRLKRANARGGWPCEYSRRWRPARRARADRAAVVLSRLVRKGEKHVRTGLPLVDTIVAEPPVAFVAHFATPVALIGPDEAPSTESSALEPISRVVGR